MGELRKAEVEGLKVERKQSQSMNHNGGFRHLPAIGPKIGGWDGWGYPDSDQPLLYA
jgi:hypothetical protein